MPTPINKVIHYKNADKTYLHNIFDLDLGYIEKSDLDLFI
jgi:hypothetical protein